MPQKNLNENRHTYQELYPSKKLDDFISLYFMSTNTSKTPLQVTICPDSYFKILIQVKNNKITSCFLTGIWTKEVEISLPPQVICYGIKFKIIAPEYLLKREIKSILNSVEHLDFNYLNINSLNLTSFKEIANQLDRIFTELIPPKQFVLENRLRLSQFLYNTHNDIKASEVPDQIYWSHRQINRYLNKYIGITLKQYLNIRKCYRAYLSIRIGDLFPEKDFFDQAHFIKQIKKHTGQTPKFLFQNRNDQFIQLRNIKKL